jgi:hypothetical protein
MSQMLLVFAVAGVEVLNHLVLVLDVLLDALQVLGDLPVRLLLQPVDRVLLLLRRRQDVLDGVGDDEVFIGFQAHHWLLVRPGDYSLLVRAVIRKVSN